MSGQRFSGTVWWGVGLAVIVGGAGDLRIQTAVGQTIFADDFSDGDNDGWTRIAEDEDQPWGRGIFDANPLAYHLATSGAVPQEERGLLMSLWDGSSDAKFTDGFLRAKVQADSQHSLAWLAMRADAETMSGYIFGGSTRGGTGVFFFNEFIDNILVEAESFQIDTPFAVGEQWIIEAGTIDDQLSMRMWQPGDPEPPEPQWTRTDSTLTSGVFGVGVNHLFNAPPVVISATFDDITFSGPLGPGQFLYAGDADQNLEFDQLDLVQVSIAGKYLSGQPATWGEGDWNGAPGGEPGNPPEGNGLFDQLDIIRAMAPGHYLTGPYAAITIGGAKNDDQTSIVYNAITGELSVDVPAGQVLTSINIDSATGIFTGQPAQNLGGSFDNDIDANIFKATFGSSFSSVTFGPVAQTALSEEFVAGDLTVVGSLKSGGDLGDVDLVYIPEPPTAVLLSISLAVILAGIRRF